MNASFHLTVLGRALLGLGLATALNTAAVTAHAEEAPSVCGVLRHNYGPFDYRKPPKGLLDTVQFAHFTSQVENLVRGQSSYYAADDLSYTLRVFPNHHRALLSVFRLGQKTGQLQPPHLQYSVECYFDRAVRFQPNDTVVRTMFARLLLSYGRREDALRQLAASERYAGDNPMTYVNIGLVYVDLKDYEQALQHAYKARQLGMPTSALESALRKADSWREPAASAPEPAAPASVPAEMRVQ